MFGFKNVLGILFLGIIFSLMGTFQECLLGCPVVCQDASFRHVFVYGVFS